MSDLLELIAEAVIRLDANHAIVEASASTETLTGHPPSALLGQSIVALLEPRGRDGKPLWIEGWHRSSALRSVRTLPEQLVTLRRADGTDVQVFVTGRYLRAGDGTLEGAVLVAREAARRAHQTATGIEIVSTVSHELRSPLTSVKGYTSLLLNRWDRLSDDQKRMMLEQVNHDADRVTRLITELLDISRLETGRLVLRRQLVDLVALTESVVEKVRMEWNDLEATVRFDAEFPRVYADPDKIEQVLTNLVENACKYATPVGLTIDGTANPKDVSIAVTDRGEGIPDEDMSKVFTKFFRRAEGRPTGSGLGLWISRGLVEAHGGRLGVSSIAGHGTTFRFTLPTTAFEELHGQ
jgi:PAS domain S-box-containing protein